MSKKRPQTWPLLIFLLWITSNLLAQDFASLKAQAEEGDIGAELQLAKAYDTGRGVSADHFEAAAWYRKAADAGNAEAQNGLGVKYKLGEGVPKDPALAVQWYRKAAKSGYPYAMFNLGAAYYNGDGVAVDDAESLAWFEIAAEFGSPSAPEAVQRALTDGPRFEHIDGLHKGWQMLLDGDGVPARPEAAVKVIQKTIAIGSNLANLELANLYVEGKGLQRNPVLAFQSCDEAAVRNYPPAMTCMGQFFQTGIGVAADLKMATEWYQKGARCGERNSILRLAKMFEEGSNGQADKVQALAYYLLAANALPEAKSRAEDLQTKLSKRDQARALKRAQELRIKVNAAQLGKCDWSN